MREHAGERRALTTVSSDAHAPRRQLAPGSWRRSDVPPEDYEGFGAPLSHHIWLKRMQWFEDELGRHVREALKEAARRRETETSDRD